MPSRPILQAWRNTVERRLPASRRAARDVVDEMIRQAADLRCAVDRAVDVVATDNRLQESITIAHRWAACCCQDELGVREPDRAHGQPDIRRRAIHGNVPNAQKFGQAFLN